MGTNYYLTFDDVHCDKCGHAKQRRHIGKSSAGWCFALHVEPEEGVRDLSDWIDLFEKPGAVITDEYGDTRTVTEMLDVIVHRHWRRDGEWWAPFYASQEQFYERNSAEPGPNGLDRYRIGLGGCIGHGSGTWDLIVGEFS